MKTEREIEVSTPLGDGTLLFHRMTGTEELGRLFRFELDLLSDDEQVDFDSILGQNVTVRLELPAGETRCFNGDVARIAQVGRLRNRALYRATLRPWLWFLSRSSDCRIFQDMSVPDIVKQVFRDHGFTDFEENLSDTYGPWEYCVQYRETAFNFVSRLLEQEGIYYYFKQEDGKHTLVLADSYDSHAPIPGYETVPYFPPQAGLVREEDHIFEWLVSQEVQPGTYAITDFDFESPRASLLAKSATAREHTHAEFEIFDYPGEYTVPSDGEAYAKVRVEELHAQFETVEGRANTRGLLTGGLFKLAGYPRADQNREYLIVSMTHELEAEAYESGAGGAGPIYACGFTAIEAKQPFRPARITPKPLVQGPQTAIVVGKAGQEIWTDKYSRDKVQFHWDRHGKADENSSCWVRVAQLWSGKNWGMIHVPRMGQEVIVEFLEGDPDQPIITGRTYNADQMPPYDLPANATQSGIKSRSSMKGSTDNFNEIRFEDKKGGEQVYIHAEKNEDVVVESDKTESVGHDETITIGNDRTETVQANETMTVMKNRTRTVNQNEDVTVAQMRNHTVGVNETITVGVAQEISIGAMQAITVGAKQTTEVGVDQSTSVGNDRKIEVGNNQSTSVGKDETISVGENQSTTVGKKLSVVAGEEILIQTGKASILMKKDGSITIAGKDLTIQGSGAITVKASKDITMKGKKILQN